MKNPILVGACLLALLPAGVSAQAVDAAPQARFVFGPLGLTPRFAIKDFGVDSNPRNDAAGAERDLTVAIEPGVDSTLRMGRSRLSGKTSVEYVYFSESEDLRAFNVNQDAKVELLLNRVTPFAIGTYRNTRQRPNLEIDERVQQNIRAAGGGFQLKLGARSNVEFEGRRSRLSYGEGEYGDETIALALDHETDAYSVMTKTALTAQTTLVVRGERLSDRFVYSPVRDTDSVAVVPGFEFKPTALLAGKVMVGYRQFEAIDPSVPDFGGLVGDMDLNYTWRETTRINLKAARTIEFSAEDSSPYFISNGGLVEVLQSVGLNWYAVARGGRTRLNYRRFVTDGSAVSSGVGRTDRVDLYGVGFGRRIRDDLRIGVDLNHSRRTSIIPERQYEGYRVGVSITYGS